MTPVGMTHAHLAKELVELLREHGWHQAVSKRPLAIFRNAADDEIVVPLEPTMGDFASEVDRAITRTSAAMGLRHGELVQALTEPSFDRVSFRLAGPGITFGKLPLRDAVALYEGARRCFAASACSVTHPRPFHPRLTSVDAESFMNEISVGPALVGSYVVPFETPVRLENETSGVVAV